MNDNCRLYAGNKIRETADPSTESDRATNSINKKLDKLTGG
jgi:hypothetical protein